MKKISILALYLLVFTVLKSMAISSTDVVGVYEFPDPATGYLARVKVSEDEVNKNTFIVRIIWSEDLYDENGKMRVDEINPDESLRGLPADQILLVKGLFLNEEEERWESDYFYHPMWGKIFDVHMSFESPTRLKVRGFWKRPIYGQTIYWKKIE